MTEFDLAEGSIRELNSRLHKLPPDTNERAWRIVNPRGAHSIAVGLTLPIEVRIEGHVGYYCAGMNKEASVTIDGQCGWGLAENIMSGTVRVTGNASQGVAATGRGGLVVVERRGRVRMNHLNAVPIQNISRRWIKPFEKLPADRLLRLKNAAEAAGEKNHE